MLPGCSRHPARDVSLLYWTDSTCASERGLARAFLKRFFDAARVPEGEPNDITFLGEKKTGLVYSLQYCTTPNQKKLGQYGKRK